MNLKPLITSILILIILKTIGQDFEVSPVKMNFNASPGSVQVKTFIVKNHGNTTQSFMLSLGDFVVNSQGVTEYGVAGSNKKSVSEWVTISPTFFDIRPNEEQIVSISMQPPVDDFGSRWGIVYVRTAVERKSFESDKDLSAGLTLSPRIAVELYQTPVVTTGILSAKIDQLREIESDDVQKRKFTALVTNNSEIIISGKVYLVLANMETGKETVYPSTIVNIYPKNTQRVNFEIKSDMPAGYYSLSAILDYGNAQALEGVQMAIEIK